MMIIKKFIPSKYLPILKDIRFFLKKSFWALKNTVNKFYYVSGKYDKYKKLHIGCGDVKLEGFINIDYRPTKATDIYHDCTDLSIFPESSMDFIYAHAFLEHLKRFESEKFIKNIRMLLNNKGILMILGIPDFEETARAYLSKRSGIIGKKFDLFNVYRYTHGDPEQYPKWWLEQLHKSLFDVELINTFLQKGGFKNFLIFRYCFKNEKIPLNLGFIAKKDNREILNFKNLEKYIILTSAPVNIQTIKIIRK